MFTLGVIFLSYLFIAPKSGLALSINLRFSLTLGFKILCLKRLLLEDAQLNKNVRKGRKLAVPVNFLPFPCYIVNVVK